MDDLNRERQGGPEAHCGIAFFDLDKTLIKQDSLLLWLSALCGRTTCALNLIRSLPAIAGGPGAERLDWRSRLKAALLLYSARGIPAEAAAAAGETVRRRVDINPPIAERLHWHRGEGHRVVIVTGAPGIYVPALLGDIGYDDLIATELAVDETGRLTGRLAAANNVRAVKAARVRAYLDAHGPFAESWGYGNRPHDEAMLALLDHATFV